MSNESLKNSTVSGFFWKICERIAAQAVSFVVTIILARILMPEDYAPVTLLTVFITIANIFISDGFCAALIQKKDVKSIDYTSVLICGFSFSILLYLVMFLVAPFIAAFYKMPILTSTLRVLSLRIPIASINSVEVAYLTKNMRFKSFFWGTFIGTVISAVVGILCALNGFGTWSLVAQNLSNYTIDTIVLGIIIHKIPKLRFSFERVKPLISYGYKILMTNILSTFVDQLRTLIIGKKYTPDNLSYYSKGRQFPNLFSTCISGPMTSVLFPTMSAINDNTEKVKSVFRRSIQVLSYVISPILMGLAATSEILIKILLTEKWLPAVPFMCIFCIYYLFPPIHSINLEAVKAIGRGDQIFKYGIIKRGIAIGTLLIAVFFNVYAIAISTIISAILACIVNAYQNKQLFGYTYSEQLKDWIPNLILSFIMFAVVLVCGKIIPFNDFVVLFFQVIIGTCLYVLLSIVSKNSSYYYIKSYGTEIIRKKKSR